MTALSRRSFAQILGAGAAAAVLPFPALAAKEVAAKKPIRLSSNENPFGPSMKALDAMSEAFSISWRYPDEAQDKLVAEIAKMHAVAEAQVLLGNGSGEILKIAALAFLSRERKLVMASPTFEAISRYTTALGGETVLVPLDARHAHDLAAMGAVKDAGLIYICNPNNPTATITPRAALASFLDTVPASTVVLVDEAYHHYADSPDYASVIPLVRSHPNLLVARTFSKIYGMAGLRCGYAVAQHELLQKMSAQQPWDSVNAMAIAAARASLADPYHVRNGRKRNSEIRAGVAGELAKLGFQTLPSQANFIMIDLGREVRPVIAAFKQKDVHVGRLFPAMPKHLRVTIGRPEEMNAFLGAFKTVMA